MTRKPDRPRGFEDRLLSELKTYVSERTQTMTNVEGTPQKAPRFSRGKKFSLAGGIGAAALGIGAIVALPALTASPAFAVEEKDNGFISVEIRNPEDAGELEEALAEHGIKAKVDFPPKGYVCDPDRYTPAEVDADQMESLFYGNDDDGNVTIGVDVDPKNYPLGGDTTLVLEFSAGLFTGEDPATVAQAGLAAAKGEVGECNPVEAPEEEIEMEDGGKNESGSGGDKGTTEKKDDDGSKDKD